MIVFPPRCAARFRAERLLASGGFGSAFLAHQTALGRPAVVKMLHSSGPGSEQDVKRFLNEARIASLLRHESIVEVYDCDVEDGVPWIAYEYIEGRTLSSLLAEGPLDAAAAVEVGIQIASALGSIHAKQILHRDVKPQNIIISGGGTAKIIDFGIAQWRNGKGVRTAAGIVFGTPAYMAPEYISGKAFGAASDIYALGIVLFEALTGRCPFAGETPTEILSGHLETVAPAPSGVNPRSPAELDAIVCRALEKQPSHRYAAAAELELDLIRVKRRLVAQAGRPHAAASSSVNSPARGYTGRASLRTAAAPGPVPRGDSPGYRRAAGLGLASLIAALLGLMWGAHRTPPRPITFPGSTSSLEASFDLQGRALEVRWKTADSTAPARVRVRAAGQPAHLASIAPGATTTRVAGLTQTTSCAVELLDAADRPLAPPFTVRTPPHLRIVRFACFPDDRRALIDLAYLGAARPTISLERWDRRSPAREVTYRDNAGEVRVEASGLEPDTTYRLDVRHPQAFGGLAGFRFTTASAGSVEELRELEPHRARRQGDAVVMGALVHRQSCANPRLVDWFREFAMLRVGRDMFLDRELLRLAGSFRDRKLAELVVPDARRKLDSLEPKERIAWLASLLRAGHPGGTLEPLARLLPPVGSTDHHATLEDVARACAERPGRFDAATLARALEHGCGLESMVHALIAADPEVARQRFRLWLQDRRFDGALAAKAAYGLAILAKGEDIRLLAELLVSAPAVRPQAMVLAALAAIDHPAARQAVLKHVREGKLTRYKIWAAVRAGLKEVTPDLVRCLKPHASSVPHELDQAVGSFLAPMMPEVSYQGCDVLIALGCLSSGDGPTIALLHKALRAPFIDAARAAAWSLGHLGDRTAGPEIVKYVLPRDSSGAAVWALGQLREPTARDAIGKLLAATPLELGPCAEEQREIALWAQKRIEAGTAEAGERRRFFLFPFLPLLPTGIRLWSEDAFSMHAGGRWGYREGNKAPSLSVPTMRSVPATDPSLRISRGPCWLNVQSLQTSAHLQERVPCGDGPSEIVLFPRSSLLPDPDTHLPDRYVGVAIIDIW